jgi:transcriptional regulator with XRE-family HTH domain
MDAIEQQGHEMEQAIARRIRQRRQALGWTLDRLAQVTGLSKGYLSQIENCEKNPPISTLIKIAHGLGIDVMELIGGNAPPPENKKISLVKATARMPIFHPAAPPGSSYEAITHKKSDRLMDAYIVTVSHEWPEKPLLHPGHELAFALEGTQEFHYDGQTYLLEPGDCLYFDSDRPHMSRSVGRHPARVLVVFCNSAGFP